MMQWHSYSMLHSIKKWTRRKKYFYFIHSFIFIHTYTRCIVKISVYPFNNKPPHIQTCTKFYYFWSKEKFFVIWFFSLLLHSAFVRFISSCFPFLFLYHHKMRHVERRMNKATAYKYIHNNICMAKKHL